MYGEKLQRPMFLFGIVIVGGDVTLSYDRIDDDRDEKRNFKEDEMIIEFHFRTVPVM